MNFITNYLDKTLIPGWRKAWKLLSVQFNAGIATAAIVWNLLPVDAKTMVVNGVLAALKLPTSWAVLAMALITIYLRLRAQKKVPDPADDDAASESDSDPTKPDAGPQ